LPEQFEAIIFAFSKFKSSTKQLPESIKNVEPSSPMKKRVKKIFPSQSGKFPALGFKTTGRILG
jgi:hypothetical protein